MLGPSRSGNLRLDLRRPFRLTTCRIVGPRRSVSTPGPADESTTRATHLSSQLLTFAKGGAPVKRPTHLGQLLEKLVRFDLLGSGVVPVIRYDVSLWTAGIDVGQIQQLFSNLIVNAKQAMPNGGNLEIELENVQVEGGDPTGLERGRYVRITVTDEGTGIDEEELEQVFDPYFTTKGWGRGLGLVTAYSILQRHAGHVAVVSTSGKGTTVTLHLPAVEPSTDPVAPPLESREPCGGSDASVLVMDDDRRVINTMRLMLQALGCSVEIALGGAEAIEQYALALREGRRFDLVILDLTVPAGIGGKEALAGILECDPSAAAIVSSGYTDDPVLADPTAYGSRASVSKPFTLPQLATALQPLLGRRAIESRVRSS